MLADGPPLVFAAIKESMRSTAGSIDERPQGASGRRNTRRLTRKSRNSGGS
jgi:hypothetical protein